MLAGSGAMAPVPQVCTQHCLSWTAAIKLRLPGKTVKLLLQVQRFVGIEVHNLLASINKYSAVYL